MTVATAYGSEWLEHDGTVVTIDGLKWIVRADSYRAKYPVERVIVSAFLKPTSGTKRSNYYKRIKADLRDDWGTDLISSEPEFSCEVLRLCQAA